jgi:hypothetical protein
MKYRLTESAKYKYLMALNAAIFTSMLIVFILQGLGVM